MRRIPVILLAAAQLLAASPAFARTAGTAVDAQPSAGEAIAARILEARRTRPESFARLQELIEQTRSAPVPRRALQVLSRHLRAVGDAGLYPMLAVLQPGAPELASLRAVDPARAELVEATLLDALGRLRDRAAAETFRAALVRPEPEVARAAARGLGRLCGDDEIGLLAQAGGRAVEGLGYCRRPEAGAALRRVIASAAGEADALEAAARAAGNWGSSWAWQALGEEASAASLSERRALAAQLAASLPGATFAAREEIVRALLLLELPETEALADSIQARDPAAAALLRSRLKSQRR